MTAAAPASGDKPVFPRQRWWWLGLCLLLMLAGWLYLRGYDVSLPYFAQIDEPHHLLAAQHEIDTGTARPVGHEAYPPGMRTLHYLLLKHIKPAEAHFSVVMPAARLLTIAAWLLLALVIALLGAVTALPLTGLMAAAIWIVNPWVVERAHWALPDAYLALFTLLSLWLALVGCQQRRPSFSTAAVYSIMLAIVFKYTALVVAPIALLMPLAARWRSPMSKTFAWQQSFWNCLRFAIFLFWLLLIFPMLEASSIPHFPVTENRLTVPQLDIVYEQSLQPLLETFQPLSGWLGIAALGLLLLLRYRGAVHWLAIFSIAVALCVWLLVISMLPLDRSPAGDPLRQLFTAGALLALVFALAFTGLYHAGRELLTRLAARRIPPDVAATVAALAVALAVALALAISLYPAYLEADGTARFYALPDRRNDLRHYMDTSVEPGSYISHAHAAKIFNRSWGAYTGLHDFPRYPWEALLNDKPIETWRALGITYAIMPHKLTLQYADIYYPEATVTLKTYPVAADFLDTGMVVLRLYPMQYLADAQLGPIHLVGYDLNTRQAAPGDALTLRHYWQAESPTLTAHHVYNHLLNAAGEIVTQTDYVPLWDARRPSTSWDDPAEILLGREFTLALPPDLPPGKYRLVSGFFDPDTWQRLTNAAGADHILLSEITMTGARDA